MAAARFTRGGVGAVSALAKPGRKPTTKEPSEFGRLLKVLRVERNLSQAQVAHRANVSPGYIGLIEVGDRGQRPALDIVKRFGQALNATIPEMEELLRAGGHLGVDEKLISDERPSFAAFVMPTSD